jgi:serine/threonine protein kinase
MNDSARSFGAYEIQRELGRGGMGVVYKAYEKSLRREVALKILPRSLSSDPLLVKRFMREARAGARINHPNAVRVYKVGKRGGTHFIAMEYVEGETLDERMKSQNGILLEDALKLTQEIAEALAEAHRHNIVHRDIKPQNIMLDENNHAKVLDFGLARIAASATQITAEHKVVGTPAFMSPEQCRGGDIDRRSDIYSLGATLYTMLTNIHPYVGSSPMVVMYQITHEPFPDLGEVLPDTHTGVRQILRNMVARDPNQRYKSAQDLLRDLDKLRKDLNHEVAPQGGKTSNDGSDTSLPTVKDDYGERYGAGQSAELAANVNQTKPEERSGKKVPARWIAITAAGLAIFAALLVTLRETQESSVPITLGYVASIGGQGSDHVGGLAIDAAGNAYTTGWFSKTVDFDPGNGTFNLTSARGKDIFIHKLNPDGSLGWARRVGGSHDTWGVDVALDSQDNVYVAGLFGGSVDFDPGPGDFNLVAEGYGDVFVLKLDSEGTFLNAWRIGGGEYDWGVGVETDAEDNVYILGCFSGEADFDPGPADFNIVSQIGIDTFLCKLDQTGSFKWVRTIPMARNTQSSDDNLRMTVDQLGNVHVTGHFKGTSDFDPGAGQFNLSSAGGSDIFILKLDASGNFVWAKSIGSSGLDQGEGLATDSTGNVYVTGRFGGDVDFDPGTSTTILSSKIYQDDLAHSWEDGDAFVLKLTAAGDFQWARSMGGTYLDTGLDVAADDFGNVYAAGTFMDTGSFGSDKGALELTSMSFTDIYVQKMNSEGKVIWATSFGGNGPDGTSDLVADASGNAYIAGFFTETVDFDPGKGTTRRTAAGTGDFFITKLVESAATAD